MNNIQDNNTDETVVDKVTDTVLPLLSWCIRQFCWCMFGCKLAVIYRNPTREFKQRVVDSWENGNQFSSPQEVLSLLAASGRRRYRRKWKKAVYPFFCGIKKSAECFQVKRLLQGEWNRLKETLDDIPSKIPSKGKIEFDIAEADRKRDERFSNYGREDLRDTFPVGKTVGSDLYNRVVFETGDYAESVRSLAWEASRNWDLIKEIKIKKNDKIWVLLGISPSNEFSIEKLISLSISFAAGKLDEIRIRRIARWIIGKILVSEFVMHPYSDKSFISLETTIADGLSLEDTIADKTAQKPFRSIEAQEIWEGALDLLPPAQREASELFLRADTPQLRAELGEKEFEAKQRNFERALKKFEKLRQSGKLPT